MNPFDLYGPEFLVFYLALSAVTLGAVVGSRHLLEAGPVPRMGTPDPYVLAYLRGGANEAVRVAVLSLLDRGLLVKSDAGLLATAQAARRVRRPIEKDVLDYFAMHQPAAEIFRAAPTLHSVTGLRHEAASLGLVPDAKKRVTRFVLGVVAFALLEEVAWKKLQIAHERGRHNTGFLTLLCWLVPWAIFFVLKSRTTPVGKRVLDDFRALFSRSLYRAHVIPPGGATNELTLLLGIFGVTALECLPLHKAARELFPKSTDPKNFGSSGTGCGSSCGASGCGGGGCGGGGCGGCGG